MRISDWSSDVCSSDLDRPSPTNEGARRMVSDTIRRGAVRPLESIALGGMGPDPLPRTLVPMKATSGPLPLGDDWTYEIKWDGMRALAFVDDGAVRVQSYKIGRASGGKEGGIRVDPGGRPI